MTGKSIFYIVANGGLSAALQLSDILYDSNKGCHALHMVLVLTYDNGECVHTSRIVYTQHNPRLEYGSPSAIQHLGYTCVS